MIKKIKNRFNALGRTLNWSTFVLCALWVLAAALLVVVARQSQFVLGIDTVSYISIASQYAEGSFGQALNAYWSPLVSWLMAPLLILGLSGSVAFLAVNVLSALTVIVLGSIVVYRWTGRSLLAAVVYVLTVTPFLLSIVDTLMPDLLVCAWVVVFVYTLSHADSLLSLKGKQKPVAAGVLVGVVGVLGYFTKLYLVPVFALTVALWLILRFAINRSKSVEQNKTHTKNILISLLVTVVTVLLLATPWIVLLSLKYDTITGGSSFSVNISGKFEENAGEATRITELATPPNDKAVAYGEDRSVEADEASGPSESTLSQKISYYIGERLKAFPYYLNRVAAIWPFTIFVALTAAALILFSVLRYTTHRGVFLSLILFSVYFVGYAGITSTSSGGGNERYYWPLFILSILMASLLIPWVLDRLKNHSIVRKLIAFSIITALPFVSLAQHGFGFGYVGSIPVGNPLSIAESKRSSGINLFESPVKPEILKLADQIKLNGDISPGSKIVGDNYRMTVQLAYYLNAQAYGKSGNSNYYNLVNPIDTLRSYGIEYVLSFSNGTDETKARDLKTGLSVVGQYNYVGTCGDTRDSPVESCSVTVLKLPEQ